MALSSLLSLLENEAMRRTEGWPIVLEQATGRCYALDAASREALDEPRRLGDAQILAFLYPGEIELVLRLHFGFDLSWVTQPASGKLEGWVGIAVEPLWVAKARATLAGPFLYAIWREEEERARLCLKPLRPNQAGFVRDLRVEVCPASGQAQSELLTALSDAHPLPAFESLLEKSARGRAGEHLTRLLEFWRDSHHGAAAALWRALDHAEQMAELHEWLSRIVEARSQEEFAEDLAWTPLRPGWAAEAWIEALAGTLLDAALEPSRFERIREAARTSLRVLNEPAMVGILSDLKRQATERAAATLPSIPADSVRELVASLQSNAAEALRNRLVAALCARAQAAPHEAAWVDGSFDFSAGDLRDWHEVLHGRVRLDGEGPSHRTRLHPAALTHGLKRQHRIEVHLPFLERRPWTERLESVAGARVEARWDGRLLVRPPEAEEAAGERDLAREAMCLCAALVARPAGRDTRFDLSWSGAWRLSPVQARSSLAPLLAAYRFDTALAWLDEAVPEAEQIEVRMSLSVPGARAVAWLEAPVERSPNYKEAYAEMSVAVQQALRAWLPFTYFADLGRYDAFGAACPLIVYRCTLPFRSKAKMEFTYDIMSAESVAVARRSTGMALAAELARIEQLLLAAGKPEQARLYRPSRREVILSNVERAPRLFHSLLVADAVCVEHLIRFGVQAGGLRRALEHEPQRAMRELVKSGEELVKTMNRRLRRLYGGEDFTGLGSLLLIEATRGLNAGLRGDTTLNGILHLAARMRDGRTVQASFVNAEPGQAATA